MKTVFNRDFRLYFRAGGGPALPLVFYLAISLLIPVGIGPDIATHGLVATGVLWSGALLASLISLQHLFNDDMEDGTLERLLASPLPLETYAAAKMAIHWLLTGLPICLAAPLIGLMLNLPPGSGIAILVTLMAGTPAISAIGIFGAALTAGLGRSGLLSSVLVVPLCVPTLIFGSVAASRLAEGVAALVPLTLLGAISLACLAVIPIASAKVLRINLG